MKTQRLSRRQRTLLNCAPIDEEPIRDRSMRSAVFRARGSNEFANQQSFDRAMAALVDAIPIPAESAEWFSAKDFVSASKWTWRKMARNPAVLAVGIAVLVIAGVFIFYFVSRLNDFPGSATARKLLTLASSTRSVLLDPINADAGTLGDLFFMKHGLEHYEVPPEFADFRTIGCRVFEDEESRRIAQIWLAEKRMQLFLFPAERNAKTGAVLRFPGWRYIQQEGWTGAVTEHNGVCFMAALRGRENDLAPYLAEKQ
ncbi:MAG: hypothetical protein DME54_07920 [Verrucomicrobia bacterium]|nr:MAG: hypothetical protein DME62_02050 [Verrucomicrobiota bacterium]PYK34656.1 MAG: hypothetical protein DME54_07920 [Verrucomicrobiota bacterium]PYL21239.1 MAG: hypothetical protein DMF41_03240 [Verrucomicrobiota bacterium]